MRLSPTPIALAVVLASATGFPLAAQGRASALVAAARAHLAANQLDSADVLLRAALDSAAQRSDSVTVFVWRAVLAFLQGDESRTSAAFHQALVLDSSANVQGLDQMSRRLQSLWVEERLTIAGNVVVHTSGEVDEKPQLVSGPPLHYPPDLLRRQVRGRALVGLTVDTAGHAIPGSVEILSTPDTGYAEPLRQMLIGSTFSRGRIRGRPVHTMIELAIDLAPGTPPNATALVGVARAALAAHRPDSALSLLRDALDPGTHPTQGERVYALLVRGNAWHAAGQDSLARADYDTALAGYRRLLAQGIELAPLLKRLADSVRLSSRRAAAPDALARPLVLGTVDMAPALLSHPPIRYPPEMQALRVAGTVTVEATIDTTGRVVPGSAKVVQSPNPGLDAEALRVVGASVYRPGRRGGRRVATVVRQAITFAPY